MNLQEIQGSRGPYLLKRENNLCFRLFALLARNLNCKSGHVIPCKRKHKSSKFVTPSSSLFNFYPRGSRCRQFRRYSLGSIRIEHHVYESVSINEHKKKIWYTREDGTSRGKKRKYENGQSVVVESNDRFSIV